MRVMAQVFRSVGSVFGIMADRENNTKKIFIYNGVSNVFCAIQYFLLNAVTGGICSILAILRNVIFVLCKDKKQLFIVLPIYFLALILLSISDIDGFMSVIPLILVIGYSIALAIGNVYILKYTIIGVVFLEIFYDIYCGAYVGVAVCIIDIVLVSISLIKLYKNKNSE